MTPRARHLRRKYGIDEAQYQEQLRRQNGVCALCGKPPANGSPLVVDHDHTSGRLRGLLHSMPCNRWLGYIRSADLAQSMADYLRTEHWLPAVYCLPGRGGTAVKRRVLLAKQHLVASVSTKNGQESQFFERYQRHINCIRISHAKKRRGTRTRP
jgi:hypothetical protein